MHYYGTIKEQLELPPLTEEEKVFVHTHTPQGVRCLHRTGRPLPQGVGGGPGVRFLVAAPISPAVGGDSGVPGMAALGRVRAGREHQPDRHHGLHPVRDGPGGILPAHHHLGQGVHAPSPTPKGCTSSCASTGSSRGRWPTSAIPWSTRGRPGRPRVRFWAYRDQALEAEVHIESFWDIMAAMQRGYKDDVSVF